MVGLIQWEIILFLELTKYTVGYLLSKRETSSHPRRMWGIVSAALLLVPIVFKNAFECTIQDIYIVLVLSAVIAVITVMDIPVVSRIWHGFILFLCITSLDSVTANIIDINVLFENTSEELKTIIWSSMTLSLLIFVYLLKYMLLKHFPTKRDFIGIQLTQLAIIFSGICQCFNAAIIVSKLSDQKSFFVMGLLSYLGVAFLGSQIWIIINMNKRMSELIKEERVLHVTQKGYYQSLLEREDETRKYRHDMTNHLMVMNALLNDNSIAELKEYLGNLREEFSLGQSKKYITGNPVIDAISCYYLPSVADFTDIKIRGHIPTDIKVDEVGICTIYSNLIKNAVEELQRLKDSQENDLKLLISFKAGEEFLNINIKNSMRENTEFRGIDTPTSKQDAKNHGIGLGNIRRTVEKEHGKIRIEQENQMFLADVILPIK